MIAALSKAYNSLKAFNIDRLLLGISLMMGISSLFAFLRPFSGTVPLISIGFGSLFLAHLYKELGLSISYVLLTSATFYYAPLIPLDDRLWQMGVVFTMALEIYLVLLVSDESVVLKEGYQEKEDEARCAQEKLTVEVEKWKEEAKARLIEKNVAEKKLKLALLEVETFGSQKDQLLESTYEATSLAKEREEMVEELIRLVEEKEQSLSRAPKGSTNLELEGLHHQLRSQFDEKTKILSKTREELFYLEGKYLALKQEQKLKEPEIDPIAENLGKALDEEVQENEKLKKEISNLEELVSHVLLR